MKRRNFLKCLLTLPFLVNSQISFGMGSKYLIFYGIAHDNNDNALGATTNLDFYYIPAFSVMAKRAGIYDPIFPDLQTYDLIPVRNRFYTFTHVDFSVCPTIDADIYIWVRLPSRLYYHYDRVYNVEGAQYDQPLLFIFLRWCQSDEHYWWMNDFEKWSQWFGCDYTIPPRPMPSPDPDDISDLSFYKERPMNCATKAAWSLIYALYRSGADWLRDYFRNAEYRHVIDCLSPGALLWLMDKKGFGEITYIEQGSCVNPI